MTSTPADAADPTSPIDRTTMALLALFEGPLSAVRFPDVDSDILAGLAAAVRASSAQVAAARSALVAAQTALGAAENALVTDEQALLVRCQRALAYAHVYAAGDPALRDALDAIHFTGAAPSHAPPVTAAPRRRGRPRKLQNESADQPQAMLVASSSSVAMNEDDEAATAAE